MHVVGSGFAGVRAARAVLRRSRTTRVVLVSAVPYATMVPALPDVLSRRIPRNALSRNLEDIFARYRSRISLVVAEITEVNLEERVLRDTAGGRHPFHALVIATGSVPEFFQFSRSDAVHTLHSLESSAALRAACDARPGGPLVVVGAGYTGLEAAACLRMGEGAATQPRREVVVVERADGILPFLPEKQREKIRRYLESIGVTIRTGISLADYRDGTAVFSDGTTVAGATVCWSAGMRGAPLTFTGGDVQRSPDGRIAVTETLELPDHQGIFVAGDAALLQKDGTPLRRAVNFAWYSGSRAGANGKRFLQGKAGRPFRPVDLGWVIPVGRTSRGKVFGIMPMGGTLGVRLHYFMCGFRHFGVKPALQYYATALRLSRRPG